MKGSYLGEFQEIVLLVVLILADQAYGVAIQDEIRKQIGRKVSRGALHTALTRLEQKGFLRSEMRGATAIRGGRRKRYYTVTHAGQAALAEAQNIREKLMKALPDISLNTRPI